MKRSALQLLVPASGFVILVALAAVAFGPHDGRGGQRAALAKGKPQGEVVPFAETAVFLEFNSTDLDLGFQLFFDADAWEEVEVSGPDGTVFEVENDEGLKEIGSTEVFTESAEPELDEENLQESMAEFLEKFPEGVYEFEGETIEGDELEGMAVLTHDLPAPVYITSPDELDPVLDPEGAVIEWEDTSLEGDPEIVRYHIVVEFEEEETEAVFEFTLDVLADPGSWIQSVTVPPEFFESLAELEGEYKAEVLAVEPSGNKTITEREFELLEEE